MRPIPWMLAAALLLCGCSAEKRAVSSESAEPRLTGEQMIEKVRNDPNMDPGRKQLEIQTMQSSPLFRAKLSRKAPPGK